MKYATFALAAAAAVSMPAFAASMTVKFEPTEGETLELKLGDDGVATNTADGSTMAYTYDEATKTLCGEMPDGEVCATFDAEGTAVGDTANYTATNGNAGVATITAMEE